mmetsp:Transcript_6292/g.10677  ORF Transcript_6292/g.10677 Transcript_6292/m.10677 type:complete len:144 (+) Transcript_6292:562-993(+)
MERYNGNPNVIVVDPEIHQVKLNDDNLDFIILGCDGIFDRMTTEHCCQEIWASQMTGFLSDAKSITTPHGKKNQQSFKAHGSKNASKPSHFTEETFHQACGHGVDQLLIKAMKLQSLDNLSIVMIGLKNFRAALEQAWEARNS